MCTDYSHSTASSKLTTTTATTATDGSAKAAAIRTRPEQVSATSAVDWPVSSAFRADHPTVLDSFGTTPDLTSSNDLSPSSTYQLAHLPLA
jgi:hypothetical protein